ncbi:MAG: hypothetical protein ACREIV_05335, partial [Planctomycetaceae bacterium]
MSRSGGDEELARYTVHPAGMPPSVVTRRSSAASVSDFVPNRRHDAAENGLNTAPPAGRPRGPKKRRVQG